MIYKNLIIIPIKKQSSTLYTWFLIKSHKSNIINCEKKIQNTVTKLISYPKHFIFKSQNPK